MDWLNNLMMIFFYRMFFQLPGDIKTKIFEFDTTGRDFFDKTLHQIQMVPTMKSIDSIKNWSSFLFSVRYRKISGLKIDREWTRDYYWKTFKQHKLKKKN